MYIYIHNNKKNKRVENEQNLGTTTAAMTTYKHAINYILDISHTITTNN